MWFWLSVFVFFGLLIAVGVIVDRGGGSSRNGPHDHLPDQGGRKLNPYEDIGSKGLFW
jgi:hypothetical protein